MMNRGEDSGKHYDRYFNGRRKGDLSGAGLSAELAESSLHLLRSGNFPTAEKYLRECLILREADHSDTWLIFNTRSMLGEALFRQRKYAEAEPFLRTGYEGMKKREKTIPPAAATRLPEALDRLIAYYTATDAPDEAARWRAVRREYREVIPMPRAK